MRWTANSSCACQRITTPTRAYRVVYVLQAAARSTRAPPTPTPCSTRTRGGHEEAVYVGISVPDDNANPGCYDVNTGPESQEWEAFDLIHRFVESNYCVDNNRIDVAGYDGESGGSLAQLWGCYFAGTGAPVDNLEVGPR